jgi:putative transposase
VTLVVLARFIEWRPVLIIVRPDTLVRWHRHAFRLFWRWKSRPCGRPRIPPELQQLIADMARANRTWGEERIGSELWLKLGILLSPRTIRRYMRRERPSHDGPRSQAWSTFVRNHAREMLASDFFVTVTATFRILYVFVILDVGTRRIAHWNATTEHPTADWTMQQFPQLRERRRTSPPRDSRPRQHFLLGNGTRVGRDGTARAEDTCIDAASERVLRAPHRNDST